jgi:hypothetical protein
LNEYQPTRADPEVEESFSISTGIVNGPKSGDPDKQSLLPLFVSYSQY